MTRKRKRSPQPRSECPVCGAVRTNHNMRRHVESHRDARERLNVPLELQAQMVRMHRAGKSYAAIGAELFYGASTVRRVMVANGIPGRKPGGRRPYLPADEALRRTELYGRGYSILEVARICGVSYAAVRNTLLANDVRIRPAGANLRWARSRRSERREAA